jgi:uncharacterized membrane protein YgdD (TMEM256/DUF423 family)
MWIALAGLMGASGVVLAAASAHLAAAGSGVESGAYLLLFHAAALLGGCALLDQGLLRRSLAFLALSAWVVGAALFAGDMAMRAFAGDRLFPMAAPTGGTLLIIGWLFLTLSALTGRIVK